MPPPAVLPDEAEAELDDEPRVLHDVAAWLVELASVRLDVAHVVLDRRHPPDNTDTPCVITSPGSRPVLAIKNITIYAEQLPLADS